MILADKILNLRKKNGWSQEELAEKLDVSRQAISKWESAQSTPDLKRVIEMSKLFGVSTDYLLKDEQDEFSESFFENSIYKVSVSMQDANKYMEIKRKVGKLVGLGVSLCIASPMILLILIGLNINESGDIFNKEVVIGIGVSSILFMVAVAISRFIKADMILKPFESIEKEPIETLYGVEGLVNEKMLNYSFIKTSNRVKAMCSFVISPILMIIVYMTTDKNGHYMIATGLLLFLIAMGVFMIVKDEIIWNSFKALLQKDDFSEDKKNQKEKTEAFLDNIYWPIIVVTYLIYSFMTEDWGKSWIIFPIAGVLESVISEIVKFFKSK